MEYGTHSKKEIVNERGDTHEVITKFHGGVKAHPIRHIYTVRHRTKIDDANIRISELAYKTSQDTSKLDLAYRIEHSPASKKDGYCHIIEEYTVLEY